MFLFFRFLEAEGLEKTYNISQKQISKSVDIASAAKVYRALFYFLSKCVNDMSLVFIGFKVDNHQEFDLNNCHLQHISLICIILPITRQCILSSIELQSIVKEGT